MKHLKQFGLAVAVATVLAVATAACASPLQDDTESESHEVTVSNVRVLTPTPTPSPSADSGQPVADASRGEAIYAQQCAMCHGESGGEGLAPALNTAEFAQEYGDDATLTAFVRDGRGGMPAYGTNRLSDQELADLIAFIRSLQ